MIGGFRERQTPSDDSRGSSRSLILLIFALQFVVRRDLNSLIHLICFSFYLLQDAKLRQVENIVILSGDHLYRMDYMDFVQV